MIVIIGKNCVSKYVCSRLTRSGHSALFYESDITGLQEQLAANEIEAVVDLQENTQFSFDIAEKTLKAGKRYITGSIRFAVNFIEKTDMKASDAENFFCAAALPGYERCADLATYDCPTECLSIPDGAANYILDQMQRMHITMEEAAHEAILLGYSSGDAQDSVNGMTAAYHLQWLCRSMFHADIKISDISVGGFSSISQIDLDFARDLGRSLRLCAFAGDAMDNVKFDAYVHPMLVSPDDVTFTVHNNNCYLQKKYDRAYRTESVFPGQAAVYLGEKVYSCIEKGYDNIGNVIPDEYRKFVYFNQSITRQRFYIRIPADVELSWMSTLGIEYIEKIGDYRILLTNFWEVASLRYFMTDVPVLFYAGLMGNGKWPARGDTPNRFLRFPFQTGRPP